MQCDGKKALWGTLYEKFSISYLTKLVSETYPYRPFSTHSFHNSQHPEILTCQKFWIFAWAINWVTLIWSGGPSLLAFWERRHHFIGSIWEHIGKKFFLFMFKTNWRAGHLDKVILLVWPNGKIKDVANFLMTFAKGCLNGEFSTYEYTFLAMLLIPISTCILMSNLQRNTVSKSWLKTNMGEL